MAIAPTAGEAERLRSLHGLRVLDTGPEEPYDGVTRAASMVAGTTIALVSLIDADRQWFKSRVGLDVAETEREAAFCAHAIVSPDEPLIVDDALVDPRFADNPLVTGPPHIRFYAGFPIRDREGRGLGTLCVIDREPRTLDDRQIDVLRGLAATTERLLDMRRLVVELDADGRETSDRLVSEIAHSERQLAALLEPSPDPMVRIERDGRIVAVNPAATRAMGMNAEEMHSLRMEDLIQTAVPSEAARERFVEALRSDEPVELEQVWVGPPFNPAGWYRIRVIPVAGPDGTTASHFLVGTNVTAAVQAAEHLASLALTDPLTGVANRVAIFDRLTHVLSRLERGRTSGVAVAVIDLDHFKALNDTFGHRIGDDALVAVADALLGATRSQDSVGRLGGDEFVIVLDDISSRDAAQDAAARLERALNDIRLTSPTALVTVSASIGLKWTGHIVAAEDLVSQADNALYQAKRAGRGRVWVADARADTGPFDSSSTLLRDLAAAIDREQFRLHYQPIVATDGRVTAYEALLRWQHPVHGLLPPTSFLDVLLSSGIIAPVGRWVLDAAARQAARWIEDDVGVQSVHVNLSPMEIGSPTLPGDLADVLGRHGLAGPELTIELTEQALLTSDLSTSALDELASVGVRLALDDFGTGASSLTHLRIQPLHAVKLDRSFVSGIEASPTDRSILAGVIGIARELDLEVIAEGVEEPVQHDWLVAHGCTHLQGWLHGRPVAVDA